MLILVCGLPRAGKTTLTTTQKLKCSVVHLDTCGFSGDPYNDVITYITHSEGDIVVEGVYNRREKRQELISAYGDGEKICVWLDTPVEMKRNRVAWSPSCEFSFEPPTTEEGWDKVYRVTNGEFDLQCIL